MKGDLKNSWHKAILAKQDEATLLNVEITQYSISYI